MTPGYLTSSPLGDIALRVEDDFLTGLFFSGQKYFPPIPLTRIQGKAPPLVRHAQEQIAEFFAGERRVFTVPIALRGTAFQRRVWTVLAAIPYGSVVSYSDVAKQLGLGTAHARAVGSAVGHNPVSVIVPCHRVLSTSGELTGYAGGVDRKAALLDLEGQGRLPMFSNGYSTQIPLL
ncbi:methylated-DNA--[protein]-cysteine S-methyltransferase [Paraburkholderia sp. J63]|uniref:methylated-DNA--[protein]-cysteine S-methyltransferase n=1 Tax=Paraburkholderia sp. J63 TaxID=2805434 RepID=UPI002ABDF123|nr:methylated-DNA--[protein]-cysteine S-methyltransferase [Paraburkholderia sp. J63]